MNELINIIPNPDQLPVSSFWFHLLSQLTYYLHLISAGIMFGIAIAMTVAYFKSKSDPNWESFGNEMSRILPFSIAFTVNLGVAPLLFLQVLYGNFFYTASILIGTHWLMLVLILIIGYYGAYWITFKKSGSNKIKKYMSLFVSLVLAWTAFILVNVNTLMMKPSEWSGYYSNMGGTSLNTGDSTMLPRYTFYIFLLLAIGGLFIAEYSKIKYKKEKAKPWIVFGSSLAGFSAFLTLPSFIFYIMIIPEHVKDSFSGGGLVWTVTTIICFIGLIAAGYFALKRKVRTATIIVLLDLIVFVVLRAKLRILFLEPFNDKISVVGRNTQYGVMALFLITFVIGLGVIYWILRKTFKERRKLNN